MCERSKVENEAVRGGERHVYVGLSGYTRGEETDRWERIVCAVSCARPEPL